jgi:FkbM family methyltransferase
MVHTRLPRALLRTGRTLGVLAIRALSPGKARVSLRPVDGAWRVRNAVSGEFYDFPSFPESIFVGHVGNGYAAFLGTKYQLEGFVEVEHGDTVVDVGPYVGAFVNYALPEAGSVTAVEPSPDAARLLESRWGDRDRVTVRRVAAWNESGTVELKSGRDTSDRSLIDIDKGGQLGSEPVEATRLDAMFREIDFLKLEAEGAEPEVLEGASECVVGKIAVDASAERAGDPTVGAVTSILEEREYDVRVQNHTVFGRKL